MILFYRLLSLPKGLMIEEDFGYEL
jgi:hypothetical protein